jgi:hypothetical protein
VLQGVGGGSFFLKNSKIKVVEGRGLVDRGVRRGGSMFYSGDMINAGAALRERGRGVTNTSEN